MLSTVGDIRDDVIQKLGIATTNAYYTEAILNNWVKQGVRFATSYNKWPFTEGRVQTTFTGSEEWSFEGYKADSFRILTVGGKRFKKLNFDDYLIMKERETTNNDRVYSDFGRLVFINPLADASGTLVAYGQYNPVDPDMTDLTAQTVFTGGDEEGNEAIVEEILAYANTREKKEAEAKFHHARATAILDAVWKRIEDEQYKNQTSKARGGMFDRMNVIAGGFNDDINRRDQFPMG